MSDERRHGFVMVPKTLTRGGHPDFTTVFRDVYYAVAWHAGTGEANDNFQRAYPSIARIAEMAGWGRSAVFEALKWLDEEAYLYWRRRPRTSSMYTLVVDRERFMDFTRKSGRAAAIEHNETLITERQQEGRAESACQAWSSGQKCPPVDPLPRAGDDEVSVGRPIGVHQRIRITGRTQNDIQGVDERDPEGQRDSVAAAPEPPTSPMQHTENSNGNRSDPVVEQVAASRRDFVRRARELRQEQEAQKGTGR